MLKKLKQSLEDRRRQKQLEQLRKLMEDPKPPRRPAAKCVARR